MHRPRKNKILELRGKNNLLKLNEMQYGTQITEKHAKDPTRREKRNWNYPHLGRISKVAMLVVLNYNPVHRSCLPGELRATMEVILSTHLLESSTYHSRESLTRLSISSEAVHWTSLLAVPLKKNGARFECRDDSDDNTDSALSTAI
ncbi:hypothetical protein AB6A40_006050 [Gnathostoma spinigerum]|uniref:Uncharacterized protein n=1 Tax=Gnathostoma spinigerum TaxID=75299 RepID=A0ABD6EHX6_9BILA